MRDQYDTMALQKENRGRWVIVAALLFALPSFCLVADPSEHRPKASLQLDADEATIGEKIGARLVAEGPSGILFEFPDLRSSLEPLDVTDINIEKAASEDGKIRQDASFFIASYVTGAIEIPALEIPYDLDGTENSVSTEPITLTIRSVLGSESEELADIKGPERIPPDLTMLLVILVIVLAVAAGVITARYLYRKYKNLKRVVPLEDIFSRVPPHEWVYAELDRLLGKKLLEEGRFKEFYVSLSEILKRYLEGRYRIDTLEKTTEELSEIMAQARIERKVRSEVESILKKSDIVKFARSIPTYDQSKQTIQEVYSFVDRTKPLHEPVESQEEAMEGAKK